MIKIIKQTITVLIIFSFISVSGQNTFQFRHLTVKDGLSHNNVYTLMQDKLGFVWAGTQNGLSKYNGFKFRNYYHSADDSSSLISDNFGILYQDSKQRIWMGTYRGGITCYQPKKNTVINYTADDADDSSIASNMIRGITEDKNGNIWIATSAGFSKLTKKNEFEHYRHNPDKENSLSTDNIRMISYDGNRYIWTATSFGLNRFDTKTGNNKRFMPDETKKDWISSSQIQSIYADSKGRVWVGTRDKGLFVYIIKLNKFIHYPPGKGTHTVSDKRIQSICEDSNGNFWIGTYQSGIDFYKSETAEFINVSASEDDPQSLSHNTVETIFEDNAKNLWVGTRGGGISILDLKPEKFTNYDLLKYKLKDNKVLSITQSEKGVLWLGTKSGLLRYDIERDKIVRFSEETEGRKLSNNRVRSLFADGNTIWAGTYQGGINRIEEKEDGFEVSYITTEGKEDKALSNNQVNAVFKDSKGNLWVGLLNGVNKIIFEENGSYKIQHYVYSEDEENTLSDNYITGFFEDKKGRLWVLSSFGLNLYRENTDNFKTYLNIKNNSKPESSKNSFTDMLQMPDGKIWAATNGGGLYLFEPESGKFSKPHEAEQSISGIMALLPDKENNIWLSTSKGLSKLDTKSYTITNYDIADGLAETGFNRNAACRTNEETLYFGHLSGYTRVQPTNIQLNSHKPKVVLTDFKKFNKSIFENGNSFAEKVPEYTDELKLTYDDYVVSFDFAALDLTHPEKNRYAYMLEGYTDEWIEFGNKHEFMFTNLPAGKYVLKVKASNNDGIWCEEKDFAKIKLTVKPPFWKTTWFLILLGIVLLTAIYFFIKIRTKKLKQRNEMLEQKVDERTKELQLINTELEKLSIVARETDNSVTILDKHGNFEWFNEGFSKIFGYNNFKKFTKERGFNILVGDFKDNIKHTVRQVMESKETKVITSLVEGKNGKSIWLQTTWTPILDDDGEISRLIAVDSDISNLKEAEEEVKAKNEELEKQNEEINRYNEHIRSSIRYAKTIQNSILPFKKRFSEYSDPFILYRPKDIVSGDFYWAVENKKHYFAGVIDCTGHGVPGAFMSLIGNRLLNEIVLEKKISKPNDILIHLNEAVVKALNQTETNNRDGMDVGIVRVSKKINEDGSRNAIFCGAKQDMFRYDSKNKKIIRIRGTRKSIGGKSGSNSEIFSNERFQVTENDVIYLMSDGYKDQNNISRMRFGTGRLIKLLNELAAFPAEKQKEILESVMEKFRQNEPFRDDVTILGLKFKKPNKKTGSL